MPPSALGVPEASKGRRYSGRIWVRNPSEHLLVVQRNMISESLQNLDSQLDPASTHASCCISASGNL